MKRVPGSEGDAGRRGDSGQDCKRKWGSQQTRSEVQALII